jgi:hypothetical protein
LSFYPFLFGHTVNALYIKKEKMMPLPLISLIIVAAKATAEVSIWLYAGGGVVVSAGVIGGVYYYNQKETLDLSENLILASEIPSDRAEIAPIDLKKLAYQSFFESQQSVKQIELSVKDIQQNMELISSWLVDKNLSVEELTKKLDELKPIMTSQTLENFKMHLQQKGELVQELKAMKSLMNLMMTKYDSSELDFGRSHGLV